MGAKRWLQIAGALVVLLLILQVVPSPGAENPPVEQEVAAPADVMQVLRQSCYDCHSHETTWPWYAGVAPAKWLVRDHVEDARGELNFSTWNRYDPEERAHKWDEVAEEVEEGEMPLRSYLIVHRGARLSEDDFRTLVNYAKRQAATPARDADPAVLDEAVDEAGEGAR